MMSFYSLQFPVFLVCVYIVFLLVPQRVRWVVLLGASFLFYSFLRVPYLPIALAFSILVTYLSSNSIDRATSSRTKKAAFMVGLLANISLLLILRYLPFLTTNMNLVIGWVPGIPKISIPPVLVSIGVSYFVFQALSYLMDVYSGVEDAERHLGYLALYLTFFPKLLQGPIERVGDLMPQLRGRFEFQYDNLRLGAVRFGFGLFKKLVLADRIGIFVDTVYGDVHSYTGISLMFATYLYAFQIYFDFSGYTDMALGVARMFNIQLSENFSKPYQATSIVEFWRRWHISFSRWLLDYLFIPLQMELRNWKILAAPIALFVTFLVSGFWHGASWGYIIWGLLHGIYLSCSVSLKSYQAIFHKWFHLENSRILRIWQVFATFNLVCFAWIFFRASSLADAQYVITHLFAGLPGNLHEVSMPSAWNHVFLFGRARREFVVLLFISILLFACSMLFKQRFKTLEEFLKNEKTPVRWALYYTLILALIVFQTDAQRAFIYFQF